jgi:hypothetical protein
VGLGSCRYIGGEMVVKFDASSSGAGPIAQFATSVPKGGLLKIWGFFPFWIGKTNVGLQSPMPNPTAANLEVRDGFYVSNNPAISGKIEPIVIPWDGELWILNSGLAPGESLNNIVIWDVEKACG